MSSENEKTKKERDNKEWANRERANREMKEQKTSEQKSEKTTETSERDYYSFLDLIVSLFADKRNTIIQRKEW